VIAVGQHRDHVARPRRAGRRARLAKPLFWSCPTRRSRAPPCPSWSPKCRQPVGTTCAGRLQADLHLVDAQGALRHLVRVPSSANSRTGTRSRTSCSRCTPPGFTSTMPSGTARSHRARQAFRQPDPAVHAPVLAHEPREDPLRVHLPELDQVPVVGVEPAAFIRATCCVAGRGDRSTPGRPLRMPCTRCKWKCQCTWRRPFRLRSSRREPQTLADDCRPPGRRRS